MNTIWQLQDAKNKLSEVIERALKQGPQLITRRGEKAVIVMSYKEYARMKNSETKLSDFFRASPLTKVDLNIKRDKSLPRGRQTMKYLLDTCVISELVAKQPNPHVLAWIDTVDADGVYISVITVGEITKGIEKLPNSKRRQELSDWLENELLIRFQDNLIELDVNILIQWGKLNARLEISGHRAPAIDSLIAATALEHELILVTRNESDFAGTGIEILNPWG